MEASTVTRLFECSTSARNSKAPEFVFECDPLSLSLSFRLFRARWTLNSMSRWGGRDTHYSPRPLIAG